MRFRPVGNTPFSGTSMVPAASEHPADARQFGGKLAQPTPEFGLIGSVLERLPDSVGGRRSQSLRDNLLEAGHDSLAAKIDDARGWANERRTLRNSSRRLECGSIAQIANDSASFW